MRRTYARLEDFRETINEIVDVNQYDQMPRDKNELDPEYYGKRTENSPDLEEKIKLPKKKNLLMRSMVIPKQSQFKKPTIEINPNLCLADLEHRTP